MLIVKIFGYTNKKDTWECEYYDYSTDEYCENPVTYGASDGGIQMFCNKHIIEVLKGHRMHKNMLISILEDIGPIEVLEMEN